MENNVIVQEQALSANEVIRLTALVYLNDALVKQEFESCQELIGIAKDLGATQDDISEVLTAYVKADKQAAKKRGTKTRLG